MSVTTTSARAASKGVESGIGHVLRGLRERQGLSLRTLAGRAGFSASFLSQVETGQVSPSIGSLERIATELGHTLVDLFEARQERAAVVVRADARPGFTSTWSKARVEALVDPASRWPLDALCVTLQARGSSGPKSSALPADQFAYVLDGAVTLELAERVFELSPGDSVAIPRGQPHRWVNGSRGPTQLLVIGTRRLV